MGGIRGAEEGFEEEVGLGRGGEEVGVGRGWW